MIEFWISFWTISFFLCLLLFAVVAVYVSLGAIGDIRAFVRRIDCREEERSRSSKDC